MKLNKLLAGLSLVMALGIVGCKKEEKVQLGLGYTASYEWKDTYGQVDVTAAAVVFNADQTIKEVKLDVVQMKVAKVDDAYALASGSAKANPDGGYVSTKKELGVNYNMKKFGNAIAEVDAQMEAYEAWAVGKTVAQVVAATSTVAEGGHYKTTDAALLAKCTISVRDFSNAIENAQQHKNAEFVWTKTAKTGLALAGYIYNATNGETLVDLHAVVADGGKVLAANLDCVGTHFKWENDQLMVDRSHKYHGGDATQTADKWVSKKTLGDAYGMKVSYGSQLAEWYVQAGSLESYLVGKTEQEIRNIALDEAGKPTDATLKASVTIAIKFHTNGFGRAVKYTGLEHIGPQA